MSTIRVFEEDDSFTALVEETGTEVRGRTRSLALVALGVALQKQTDGAAVADRYDELGTAVQRRAERSDVSDDVVEDAIEWARRR